MGPDRYLKHTWGDHEEEVVLTIADRPTGLSDVAAEWSDETSVVCGYLTMGLSRPEAERFLREFSLPKVNETLFDPQKADHVGFCKVNYVDFPEEED